MIVGAVWRNPEYIEEWISTLDPTRDVTVYCAHGRQVSQDCAQRLGQPGFRAAYLEGGFENGRPKIV
jgi:rhodanese-related sulfurtransferase